MNEQTTLTVNVDAVNGTPVTWLTTNGTITGSPVVTNGQAQGVLSTQNGKVGSVVVLIGIGDRLMSWYGAFRDTSGLSASADHPLLTTDAEADGTMPVDLGDGTIAYAPIYTSTNIKVVGPPGDIVKVGIPGVVAAEGYTCDAADNGTVPGDLAGHTMTLAGATLDQDNPYLGIASLRFDGQATAAIADAADLTPPGEFRVEMWINPDTAGGTLIAKGNALRLEILPDGRLRGTVTTSTGTFTATTEDTVPAGTWSRAAIQLKDGALQVELNHKAAVNASVTGTIVPNTSNWNVGPQYAGKIDEIVIYTTIAGNTSLEFYRVNAKGEVIVSPEGRSWFNVGYIRPASQMQYGQTILIHDIATDCYVDLTFGTKEGHKAIWRYVIVIMGADEPRNLQEGVVVFLAGWMPVTDIGTVIRQVWYLAEGKDDFSATQLALSGSGLLVRGDPRHHERPIRAYVPS